MDDIGVHSLLNANRSIVPDRGTTIPVQTVAGKDNSNPLMAVTLPKSEEEEISSTRRKLPQTFTTGSTSRARSRPSKKGQNKNIEKIIKETIERIFREKTDIPEKEQEKSINLEVTLPVVTPPEQNHNSDEDSVDHVSDNDFLESNYGMSFDSVARHNLDT
ncbi:hypothetical protein RND71_014447 [Anisodus tanguticus]|uniref:Uncharacterized protein n=1 Tax=Anisodus tanguticus TaxID=243964 RepID=A0AAE1SBB1_9SOLA|nr:hypothetical protein RND71_014447 [Anisodus tanguticus]